MGNKVRSLKLFIYQLQVMSKSTQAHLTRTVKKDWSIEVRQKTLKQMQYYMGAKLIEVGVDPQSVTYRWLVSDRPEEQVCTLSAFWDDSLEQLLSGNQPLTDTELIDCARANASSGIANTAKLCGYGTDVTSFRSALQDTSQQLEISGNFIDKLLK